MVPVSQRPLAMKLLHEEVSHLGRDRTISRAREQVYWPGIARDIGEWIKKCPRCLRAKYRNTDPVAPLHPIVSTYPMELICLDYLSLEQCKVNFTSILVITVHFTNYVQA